MTLALPSAQQTKVAGLVFAVGIFFAWAGLSLHNINRTVQEINERMNQHVHTPSGQVMYMPRQVPDLLSVPGGVK